MQKLYEASKRQFLSKLEYLKKIVAVIADITKSFATIIASLVATATAGITGYYEIKKVYKKETTTKHKASSEAGNFGPVNPLNATVGSPSRAAEKLDGYYFDMNSGAFAISVIMLVFFILNKFKNKPKT
jgi:hypothetical protein